MHLGCECSTARMSLGGCESFTLNMLRANVNTRSLFVPRGYYQSVSQQEASSTELDAINTTLNSSTFLDPSWSKPFSDLEKLADPTFFKIGPIDILIGIRIALPMLKAALRRFIARRTYPSKILSDNLFNFESTSSHPREARGVLNFLPNTIFSKGIGWSFIPPYAPHFGDLCKVSFDLKLYGRKTSDKQIQLSGFLEHIRPGYAIFADRGFPPLPSTQPDATPALSSPTPSPSVPLLHPSLVNSRSSLAIPQLALWSSMKRLSKLKGINSHLVRIHRYGVSNPKEVTLREHPSISSTVPIKEDHAGSVLPASYAAALETVPSPEESPVVSRDTTFIVSKPTETKLSQFLKFWIKNIIQLLLTILILFVMNSRKQFSRNANLNQLLSNVLAGLSVVFLLPSPNPLILIFLEPPLRTIFDTTRRRLCAFKRLSKSTKKDGRVHSRAILDLSAKFHKTRSSDISPRPFPGALSPLTTRFSITLNRWWTIFSWPLSSLLRSGTSWPIFQIWPRAIVESKPSKSDLALAWLDLENAVGSIPHELILTSLNAVGVPDSTSKIIASLYTSASSEIRCRPVWSSPIPMKAGLRQGCALSVILFNPSLEQILRQALETRLGSLYKFFWTLCDLAGSIGLRFNPPKRASLAFHPPLFVVQLMIPAFWLLAPLFHS
ncbi:hypothetical protein TNIN_473201 [Trichonephila inaurata madagascariensis]|uniref:Reverse transcriptase domain-containing protein n=1 Tax=Trichonephila inaurata madagascariensis TaxID=2747483 RepID=A0A8X6KC49_9ARAC|nr:hypothetical protein TNIN_473201 [Trichonephila inaurata madagascariensis]